MYCRDECVKVLLLTGFYTSHLVFHKNMYRWMYSYSDYSYCDSFSLLALNVSSVIVNKDTHHQVFSNYLKKGLICQFTLQQKNVVQPGDTLFNNTIVEPRTLNSGFHQ